MSWSSVLERFNRTALLAGAVCIALIALALRAGDSGGVTRAAILAGAVLFVYWLIQWAHREALIYGFIFLGVVFAPLPILLGLLLLPFGPGLAPFAVLLDVSAEPTPPGVWTVHQLPTQPHGEPIPLMHSASYQLPEAIELVLSWLRERAKPTVATQA